MRRAWYARSPDRSRRLERPVISIGNLVVGGSGKTPAVATVARLLLARGERPSILSRGYGRRDRPDGVVVVGDGRQVLEQTPRSGDEPQLLARGLPDVPVLVSPDRYLAGRLAERRFACTVHLLDDGFQHVQLARDVDLLLISPLDLRERLLPLGRLREPLDAARAAHAVIVTGTSEEAAAVAAALGVHAAFRATPRYQPPRLIAPAGFPLPTGTRRRAVAVAGIARPERFFAALRAEGWEVTHECVFRDHHWFSSRDLASIEGIAEKTNAELIITTEKDAMRLLPAEPGVTGTDGGLPVAYLPMEMEIEPADEFGSWLGERLAAARERRPVEAA
jgi:tetraacyldisaccharide 4'-kinase